ncbi:DUF4367 domain-containing protein [Anoxybacterium hadale]|uniref:DUF4367 domain-containing protein n=1 Tax=Anoxybacterium hadale TaxID=3408580 RepID=A0ACD1AE73_9FIRM|nr:DUF4367 domain-containing protein [Clostridiales bacterium]
MVQSKLCSKDWTKSDEELKRAINQVLEKDPELFAPQMKGGVDYYFLERSRSKPRYQKFLAVVASFLLIVVMSGAFGLWLNQESAVAAKFELERILHNLQGRLSADDDSTYSIEEGTAELTIHSPDHIDRARKFLPKLIFPETGPTGYVFKQLVIQKGTDNGWTVSILYDNAEGEALSVSYMNFEQESSVGVSYNGTVEEVQLDGITAYSWSEITGTSVLNFVNHNIIFTISSTKENDEEKLLAVARQFL